MQHPIERFRLGPRSAGFVALIAVLLLTVSSPAGADPSNLLPNGSFEAGTSGWTTTNATLAIASDGADDSAAGRIALNTSASSYQLSASPRPVKKTTAGSVYTATGVVRSDTPGKNVCLTLKEVTSGGTLVLTSDACVVAGSQWAPLPLASLTAKNDGDLITFLVRRPSGAASGESFEVDALSLVAGGGGTGSPPSTPTNVSASAVSSTEIDLSWTASTDPDPDGVAGYAIYRDGGASSIGTVGGSTTSSPTPR